jgi:hypothetical protein
MLRKMYDRPTAKDTFNPSKFVGHFASVTWRLSQRKSTSQEPCQRRSKASFQVQVVVSAGIFQTYPQLLKMSMTHQAGRQSVSLDSSPGLFASDL